MGIHRLPERWSAWLKKHAHGELGHKVFWIGIFFKTVDGILETIGAFILLGMNNQTMTTVVYTVFSHELTQDPNDWLANHLLTLTAHLSTGMKLFAVVYLLVHGVIKLVIVSAIWLSQLWAYWLAGVVFSLFVLYQTIRFAHTHSMMLLLLTVIDLVIIALLPPEHRRLSMELRQSDKHARRGVN